jgi:hypothetical protein
MGVFLPKWGRDDLAQLIIFRNSVFYWNQGFGSCLPSMSFLQTAPPPSAHATFDLAVQLEGMMNELRQTRDSVVSQIDAQISRASSLLRHLNEAAPLPPLYPAAVPTPMLGPQVMQAPPKLTSVVLASQAPAGIDPQLEQATLAELNEALSLAFTEIAGRGGMLGR